jgi:hypothetical protein
MADTNKRFKRSKFLKQNDLLPNQLVPVNGGGGNIVGLDGGGLGAGGLGLGSSAQIATQGLNVARANLQLTAGLQIANGEDAIRQGNVIYALSQSTGAIAALNQNTIPPAQLGLGGGSGGGGAPTT